MRRILAALAVVGAVAAGFLYVQSARPGWWERLWYPLSYAPIGRASCRERVSLTV